MWWGGTDDEKGPPLPEDKGEGEITPPLEIIEEDSDSSLASSPLHLSEDLDLKDLNQRFSMQEDLLGQLKGVLRSNEAKLQFKEKEVEVRVSLYSHFTSRYFLGLIYFGDFCANCMKEIIEGQKKEFCITFSITLNYNDTSNAK